MLNEINSSAKEEGRIVNLKCEWVFNNSVLYYLKRNNYEFINFEEIIKSPSDDDNTDYYIY